MDLRIDSSVPVRSFTIHDAPALDPVTVMLQDMGPGAGRLVVVCYGEAWTAYWGGMGERTVAEFVLDMGQDYIAGKLMRPRTTRRDEAYLMRIVAAVQQALRITEARD